MTHPTQIKWRRAKPGWYRGWVRSKYVAMIERGPSGWWYWCCLAADHTLFRTSRTLYLAEAQIEAEIAYNTRPAD
jgi:hypothetical protein